ncbi:hypothetical protein CYMTET_14246 [Cymbomonas tetramitiformis]|uniref:Uncharacterized protein n=1 Tax=Cymbomonas tetramitiformis TaxID=36881 RepID=A0AAE0GGQ3_9CHLO|nr:hypothetical protein CYMTET_14246 [Cymbomonas tetramitiformis]
MVEAGTLRPSSLMQVELTGRVDLRAEDLKFDNPAPGTSVTDKMLHLLQATSCGQRESNMMMRSEWGGPEGAVDAALTTPAGLTATQFDPRHPDLTQEQEAASDKEYNLASTQPWQGMAVHPWGGPITSLREDGAEHLQRRQSQWSPWHAPTASE